MIPESQSWLGNYGYGTKPIFEKKLEEGFTKVAFGRGPWIDTFRILALFAFFYPDGRVETIETWKQRDSRHCSRRSSPKEKKYSAIQFKTYIAEHHVELMDRTEVSGIINDWTDDAGYRDRGWLHGEGPW